MCRCCIRYADRSLNMNPLINDIITESSYTPICEDVNLLYNREKISEQCTGFRQSSSALIKLIFTDLESYDYMFSELPVELLKDYCRAVEYLLIENSILIKAIKDSSILVVEKSAEYQRRKYINGLNIVQLRKDNELINFMEDLSVYLIWALKKSNIVN